MEFLEGRLDGFSDEETPEFSDLLRAGSVQELRQDLEGTQTLLDALGKRLSQVQFPLSPHSFLPLSSSHFALCADVRSIDKMCVSLTCDARLGTSRSDLCGGKA